MVSNNRNARVTKLRRIVALPGVPVAALPVSLQPGQLAGWERQRRGVLGTTGPGRQGGLAAPARWRTRLPGEAGGAKTDPNRDHRCSLQFGSQLG